MSSTRRTFLLGAGAMAATTAACSNGIGSQGAERLDNRVDAARNYMFTTIPGARELYYKAAGVLVMPLITEAGLWVGGSYGQGALRVKDVTVDYYSAAQASIGFQIGAQQYAHALFFITENALGAFRRSTGWAAGADIEYAVSSRGGNVGIDTYTAADPIIGVVFGQAGLIAGATVEGIKYTRIIP